MDQSVGMALLPQAVRWRSFPAKSTSSALMLRSKRHPNGLYQWLFIDKMLMLLYLRFFCYLCILLKRQIKRIFKKTTKDMTKLHERTILVDH